MTNTPRTEEMLVNLGAPGSTSKFAEHARQLERELESTVKMIDTLNCNNIVCHCGRDILASIYDAMRQLPCNGVQAILCGAAQEIQALRDMQSTQGQNKKGEMPRND